MRTFIYILVLFWCAVAGAWPVETNSVSVPIGSQSAAQFSIPQGERRIVEATFMDGTNAVSLSGMTVEYIYKTPEATLWWSITGTVSAAAGKVSFVWDSTKDIGSPRYQGWLRVVSASNPIYRIKIDLAMIETPGFDPNIAALTVSPIDFNTLAWTNEPWAAKVELVAVNATATNALAIANSKLSVEVDPVAGPVATNALAQAGTALSWGDHRAAGYVTGTVIRAESDPLSVHTDSLSAEIGEDVSANEYLSFAMGKGVTSSICGFAFGLRCNAAGSPSFVFGVDSSAGDNSVAFGWSTHIGVDAFAWNPDEAIEYTGNGPGSVSFNASNGLFLDGGGRFVGSASGLSNFPSYIATGSFVRVESDPQYQDWADNGYQGVLTTETDPQYQEWVNGGYQGVVTTEADPLSLYLDQTTPQTTVGTFTFPTLKIGTPTIDEGQALGSSGNLLVESVSENMNGFGVRIPNYMGMSLGLHPYGLADWGINGDGTGPYVDDTLSAIFFRMDVRQGEDSFQVMSHPSDARGTLEKLLEIKITDRVVTFGSDAFAGTQVQVKNFGSSTWIDESAFEYMTVSPTEVRINVPAIIIPPTNTNELPIGALWNNAGVLSIVTE